MATDVVIVSYSVKRGALTDSGRVLEDLTPGGIGYGKVILKASTFADNMDSATAAIDLTIKDLEVGLGG